MGENGAWQKKEYAGRGGFGETGRRGEEEWLCVCVCVIDMIQLYPSSVYTQCFLLDYLALLLSPDPPPPPPPIPSPSTVDLLTSPSLSHMQHTPPSYPYLGGLWPIFRDACKWKSPCDEAGLTSSFPLPSKLAAKALKACLSSVV